MFVYVKFFSIEMMIDDDRLVIENIKTFLAKREKGVVSVVD